MNTDIMVKDALRCAIFEVLKASDLLTRSSQVETDGPVDYVSLSDVEISQLTSVVVAAIHKTVYDPAWDSFIESEGIDESVSLQITKKS